MLGFLGRSFPHGCGGHSDAAFEVSTAPEAFPTRAGVPHGLLPASGIWL